MGFTNSTVEEIKNQVNIVDVVGRVVHLKRAGSNYKGVCPFHNEKTPSFVVSEQKQIFTCFGCGASGDVIEFVKRYYNLDFQEAVEKIAGEYGIEFKRSHYGANYEKYYEANKLAARFFYKAFTETANKGYTYMKRRQISPATLKKFGIGYADEKWDSLYEYLLSKGVDTKLMVELGLVSQKGNKFFDKFRNRVMFPIINTSGKVIGFGGRAISDTDNPKYLNSPESKVFQKKNNLYGLNLSRQKAGKEGFLILVEGYMDVIGLYQSGVENVAASLGTALTENQCRLIKRYTKNVVLSYDSDNAGRNAALRGMDLLRKEDCKVKVLHVDDGKDPDEFVKKNGKKAFLDLIDGALPYGEYKLSSAKIGFDLTSDEGRIEYMKKAIGILSELAPVEQEIYTEKLSRDIDISVNTIKRELNLYSGKDNRNQRADRFRDGDEKSESRLTKVSQLEKNLLKLAFTDEAYADRIREIEGIIQSDFANEVFSLIYEERDKDGQINAKEILDKLSIDDGEELHGILNQIAINGDEEKMFNECVNSWKDAILLKEEREIINMLSLADEDSNVEKVNELTNRLVEIQCKRKKM